MADSFEDVLQHYGIKGMKWGIRRRVNPDTGRVVKSDSGKKTDADAEDSTKVSADRERASKALSKANESGLQSLSNDEIKAITKRIQAEQELNRLTGSQKSELQAKVEELRLRDEYRKLAAKEREATRSTGKKVLDSMISSSKDVIAKQAQDYGADIIKKMLGIEDPKPSRRERLKERVELMRLQKEHQTLARDLKDLGVTSTSDARVGSSYTGPFRVNQNKVRVSATDLGSRTARRR